MVRYRPQRLHHNHALDAGRAQLARAYTLHCARFSVRLGRYSFADCLDFFLDVARVRVVASPPAGLTPRQSTAVSGVIDMAVLEARCLGETPAFNRDDNP